MREVMSRDTFTEYMKAIKEDNEFNDKLNDLFNEYKLDGSFVSCGKCFDKLIILLGDLFHDHSDWIGYFIFELDFGKKYKKGTVVYNEKDVPLATVDDLYDILVENLEAGNAS